MFFNASYSSARTAAAHAQEGFGYQSQKSGNASEKKSLNLKKKIMILDFIFLAAMAFLMTTALIFFRIHLMSKDKKDVWCWKLLGRIFMATPVILLFTALLLNVITIGTLILTIIAAILGFVAVVKRRIVAKIFNSVAAVACLGYAAYGGLEWLSALCCMLITYLFLWYMSWQGRQEEPLENV